MIGNFNVDIHKYYMDKNKYTQLDIVRMLTDDYGIETKIDAVKKWTRKENPSTPSDDRVNALASIYRISPLELDTEYENIKKEIVKKEIKQNPDQHINMMAIMQSMPDIVILPSITIGTEEIINLSTIEPTYLLPINFDSKNVTVGKILGDSMEPKYNENDIVFFDIVDGRSVILPNGIYIVRYGSTVQIKSVQFLGNGDVELVSLNPSYRTIRPVKDLGLEDWEIIGKPFIHWDIGITSKLQEK